MEKTIYLDYAATTPVDERVLQAMLPYFSHTFGNPSSIHQYGQKAENAIEAARETVAGVLKCRPDEIIFTSCGSESDNLALRGASLAMRAKKNANWILTSQAEHHAVSRTAGQMAELFGFEVEWLPVDEYGMVLPQTIAQAICHQTAIVSVMLANNEIGTINPISKISEICHEQGVLLHTDAVQAAAYLPVNVDALGVDLLSLGGHKFYGPKGVGALYVRKGTPLVPVQTGGGQEVGLRAGTQNVPYIVGFAEALRLTDLERKARAAQVKPMRDRIIGSVLENIPDAKLTGHPIERLPNHCSFVFKGVDGNFLLTLLDSAGFACSSGSACKTGNPEPSEVMRLMQLPLEWGLGSLRVTLGTASTAVDVEKFLARLPGLVEKARKLQ
ncbi:MAG: cysteine desulfurase NifS [Chloroflexi bacterium GWB2_49_20]|nr:MAG: cysteine desulfurase NifS [Chloroflexi bacterium GWB2_49_20]OGN76716.1 MAG: cysteine desulfurase NifS [Chloroflexi bacterium GWC2_49_37]OGN83676.1 MAG: cysteine desulfurase NifS [Chloroflexi bacterium GWD2_49_16]HBG74202.1 cysteine desulfurase NifS [Anaerolineae bacterium]HCC78981.1 cysteine desulfurase NifS [Anaerolineae bacterium]